ncbi:hypothetical protein [Ideonella paludis]|uniref:hypothetical protein n=1 Tax=Ideonella paludis TaxID=1233411 RepID=UPI0036384C00
MSADLAGHLFVHPGAAAGATLRSTRPLLAQRLLEGRPVRQVPALVAAVYSLCAHAQRWTAERAVQAALGKPAVITEAEQQAHQAATAREHLLRIAHDWPRLWPGVAAAPPCAAARCGPRPAMRRLAYRVWQTGWLGIGWVNPLRRGGRAAPTMRRRAGNGPQRLRGRWPPCCTRRPVPRWLWPHRAPAW